MAESDLELLLRWMTDPRVLEWYEGRDQVFDLNRVRRNFLQRSDATVPCIVEYDKRPIGYAQYLDLSKNEKLQLGYELESKVFGIDQFIGEVADWNKGIGTDLVTKLSKYLCETFGPDFIVLDPQVTNERAIHVYKKCGFQPVRVLEKAERHEGVLRDCLLMQLEC